MAQSGFTQIQLYSSPTPGATPPVSNLTNGELAINAADGKLFYKDTGGNTQVVANSSWSGFSAYSTGVAVKGPGTNVVATGTVEFANSNGVTFGLSGSTITASIDAVTQSVASYNILSAGGNTAGTIATFSSGTMVLAGGSNITLSQNSNTISINAANAGNITVSAGTTSTATNNIVFALSNNISFGMTSNTITAQYYTTSLDVANLVPPWLYCQNTGFYYEGSFTGFVPNSGFTWNGQLYLLNPDKNVSFNSISIGAISRTRAAGWQFTIAPSAISIATVSSNLAATAVFNAQHYIYTLSNNTFSSNIMLERGSTTFFQGVLSTRSTISTATSYSISATHTFSVPNGTDSNGYTYASGSASISTASNFPTSASSTFRMTVPGISVFTVAPENSTATNSALLLTQSTSKVIYASNTNLGLFCLSYNVTYTNTAAMGYNGVLPYISALQSIGILAGAMTDKYNAYSNIGAVSSTGSAPQSFSTLNTVQGSVSSFSVYQISYK